MARLIKQRMEMAGRDPILFVQNVVEYTNEYSIVGQDFFKKYEEQ